MYLSAWFQTDPSSGPYGEKDSHYIVEDKHNPPNDLIKYYRTSMPFFFYILLYENDLAKPLSTIMDYEELIITIWSFDRKDLFDQYLYITC